MSSMMGTICVLVCGGRDYNDQATVNNVLDGLHGDFGIDTIIHGAARGADTCAAVWADIRLVTAIAFPADWEKHGRAAGPIRNRQMLDSADVDLVVAFPGGRGTAHMIKLARERGIDVRVIDPKTK